MRGFRGLSVVAVTLVVAGFAVYWPTRAWEGWEHVGAIVGKGDNLPIAALIPLLALFTYLSLAQAFRNDRLLREGRGDEILDEMYK